MKRLSPLVLTALLLLAAPQAALADTNSDLVAAAAHGQTAQVVALLGKGADINVRDSGGYTPLIWAALNGHEQVVGELLRRGASVSARDKEGYTALMWASQNHRADAARALMANGANPNEADKEGYTAMTWAAQDGQPGIASELLAHGADPNSRDRMGYTSLMWAAQQGHNSVVKLLMVNGANPGLRDYKGFTALDLAIAFNRYDVKDYLMKMAPRTYTANAQTRWNAYNNGYNYNGYNGYTTYQAPRRNRPGVVAVVGTPGYDGYNAQGYDPNWAGQNGYYPNGMPANPNMNPNAWSANRNNAAWAPGWNSVESRVLSFDADRNRVVDGRDWRSLTPARRSELASILHGVRVHNNDRSVNSVVSKLDWVYADANRLGLTLNMAFDFPTPNGTNFSW